MPIKNNQHLGDNSIVYRLKSNDAEILNVERLKLALLNIKNKQHVLNFLDKHLQLSKQKQSSRFVGFAIAGYKKLPQSLKKDAEVLLKYSELLEYAHLFTQAIAVLDSMTMSTGYSDRARLRMINIYSLQGDLTTVRDLCNQFESSSLWTVSTICRVWLDGMAENSDVSIQKLMKLEAIMQHDIELRLWINQLLIDLYLKQGDINNAVVNLSKIMKNNQADQAALIQIVDFLILSGKEKYADALIVRFDPEKRLQIRSVIVATLLSKAPPNFQTAERKIQLYKTINEQSQLRLIAQWEYFVNGNVEAALKYSKYNSQLFATQNDLLFSKYISKEIK